MSGKGKWTLCSTSNNQHIILILNTTIVCSLSGFSWISVLIEPLIFMNLWQLVTLKINDVCILLWYNNTIISKWSCFWNNVRTFYEVILNGIHNQQVSKMHKCTLKLQQSPWQPLQILVSKVFFHKLVSKATLLPLLVLLINDTVSVIVYMCLFVYLVWMKNNPLICVAMATLLISITSSV